MTDPVRLMASQYAEVYPQLDAQEMYTRKRIWIEVWAFLPFKDKLLAKVMEYYIWKLMQSKGFCIKYYMQFLVGLLKLL